MSVERSRCLISTPFFLPMAPTKTTYETRLVEVLNKIKSAKSVWGLQTGMGWANWREPTMLNQPIILFWTDEKAMRSVKAQYFAGYQEVKIKPSEFLDHWLGELSRQKIWPGFDYNLDTDGYHFDPNDMIRHQKETIRLQ